MAELFVNPKFGYLNVEDAELAASNGVYQSLLKSAFKGLAGHSSVAMTEKYVHLLNPAKFAGVDALPVIGGAPENDTAEA